MIYIRRIRIRNHMVEDIIRQVSTCHRGCLENSTNHQIQEEIGHTLGDMVSNMKLDIRNKI